MYKQTVVNPFIRILLRNEKEWTIDVHKSTDESQIHYAKGKKPDTKKLHTGNSTYTVYFC